MTIQTSEKLHQVGLDLIRSVRQRCCGSPADQRLQKRLALDERQAGSVSPVKMQKIESVVDEAHAALAVARGLGLRKAGQAIVTNPAQLAVEVGRLYTDLRQRRNHARIF